MKEISGLIRINTENYRSEQNTIKKSAIKSSFISLLLMADQ